MKVDDIENSSILQVGDTLICKNVIDFFEINNTYTIRHIDTFGDFFIGHNNKFGEFANTTKSSKLYEIPFLYDYFYTKDELRLKKINSL